MPEYEMTIGRRTFNLSYDREKRTILVDDKPFPIGTTRYGHRVIVDVDGKPFSIEIVQGRVSVNGEEQRFGLQRGKPKVLGKGKQQAAAPGARIKPPIPGRIVSIDVKVGDKVRRGQPLLVLEAMKMQNEVSSPVDGTVKAVHVKPGQVVDGNAVLVEVE